MVTFEGNGVGLLDTRSVGLVEEAVTGGSDSDNDGAGILIISEGNGVGLPVGCLVGFFVGEAVTSVFDGANVDAGVLTRPEGDDVGLPVGPFVGLTASKVGTTLRSSVGRSSFDCWNDDGFEVAISGFVSL